MAKLLFGGAAAVATDIARRKGLFGYTSYTLRPGKDISECKIKNEFMCSLFKFLPPKVYRIEHNIWRGTETTIDVTDMCWV